MSDKPYPKSITKDVNNDTINVGAIVAFCKSNQIYTGTVSHFTPFGLSIKTHQAVNYAGDTGVLNIQDSSQVVLI